MRFCCWLWFQITTNVCIFVSKCALLLLALVSNNDKRGSVSHCIPVAHTARAGWPTPPTGIAVLLHACMQSMAYSYIPVMGDIQPLIVVLESTMVQLPGKPVPSVPALYPLPPSSRRLPCRLVHVYRYKCTRVLVHVCVYHGMCVGLKYHNYNCIPPCARGK